LLTLSLPDDAPLRPRLEFAAKAFIIASFVGALVAGALRMNARAFASPEHRIDLSRWTVIARPAWSTLDDVREIRARSGLSPYYASVFDTAALANVDAYLARPATVKRVVDVRRAWPNRLEAVLELRRPVVAVVVPGKTAQYVETDEDGVALSAPSAARPVREGRPLRLVVGGVGAAPATGGRFGEDVIAAASLADSLDTFSDEKGSAFLSTLDRIDVSNYGGRLRPGTSEITLYASQPAAAPGASAPAKASRCVVEWGRAGGREADGKEMPFDGKASRLLQALRLFPRLDGLKTVRVAFNDLVVVPDGPNAPPQLTKALEIDGGGPSK
jgi:hypothetical protein